jgi:hypothetical protein
VAISRSLILPVNEREAQWEFNHCNLYILHAGVFAVPLTCASTTLRVF